MLGSPPAAASPSQHLRSSTSLGAHGRSTLVTSYTKGPASSASSIVAPSLAGSASPSAAYEAALVETLRVRAARAASPHAPHAPAVPLFPHVPVEGPVELERKRRCGCVCVGAAWQAVGLRE